MKKISLGDAIASVGHGHKAPALTLIEGVGANNAAIISKLTHDPNRMNAVKKLEQNSGLIAGQFKTISNTLGQDIRDSQALMDMLPDLELGSQILISSILSPKDMGKAKLQFKAPESQLPSQIIMMLTEATKKHLEVNYNINSELPGYMKKILYIDGSLTIAVIPENTIDEVINGIGMESFNARGDKCYNIPGLSILGNANPINSGGDGTRSVKAENSIYSVESAYKDMYSAGATKESFILKNTGIKNTAYDPIVRTSKGTDTMIRVYDNPAILKLSGIKQHLRSALIKTRMSTESFGGDKHADGSRRRMSADVVLNRIYSAPRRGYKPIVALKTKNQLNRPSIGEPILMILPAESVFPVVAPGDPTKKVGVFVLLDSESNPVQYGSALNAYDSMNSRFTVANSTHGPASTLIKEIQDNMGETNGKMEEYDRVRVMADTFRTIVESNLNERLSNGIYGDDFKIANRDEIVQVMLFRSLRGQMTQLLFIPEEMVTYMAHRYDRAGFGVSIPQSMKVNLSSRLAIMFANLMTSLRNSISQTDIRVKLDENDPDPDLALALAASAIARSRQEAFPIGIVDPNQITENLTRAGYRITWEGHKDLPDVSVEYSDTQASHPKPDMESDELLRKMTSMGQGLSTEMIDSTQAPEFMRSVVTNNIFLSRRVAAHQPIVNGYITDHLVKYLSNSPSALTSMAKALTSSVDILRTHYIKEERFTAEDKITDDEIIDITIAEFLDCFRTELPEPNSTTTTNQLEAMTSKEELLDKALDHFINSTFLTDNDLGDLSGTVDELKAVIKSTEMRKFMADNNIMPELAALITTDRENQPMYDLADSQNVFLGNLLKTLMPYLIERKKFKDGVNNINNKNKLAGTSSSSSDTSSDTTTGDNGDFNDDFSGDFNMDLGDENAAPGDDGTTADTTPGGGDAETAPKPEAEEPSPNKDDDVAPE